MRSRGNTLKLTAVAVLVVLGLTGFSAGRGHGGSGSGGGGGCSSSGQDHDTSSGSGGGSHRYDDDDDDDGYGYGGGNNYDNDYDEEGGTSGGSGGNQTSSLRDATVELLGCVSKKAPYATVEVTNPNAVDGVFTVTVVFENAYGAKVVSRSQRVEVAGGDAATARVPVDDAGRAPRITDCDPEPLAPAAG